MGTGGPRPKDATKHPLVSEILENEIAMISSGGFSWKLPSSAGKKAESAPSAGMEERPHITQLEPGTSSQVPCLSLKIPQEPGR